MSFVGIILTVFLLSITAISQENTPAPAPDQNLSKVSDFRPLFEERETLLEKVSSLEQTIETLSNVTRGFPPLDRMEQDLVAANLELEKAQKATPIDPQRVEKAQRYNSEGNQKSLQKGIEWLGKIADFHQLSNCLVCVECLEDQVTFRLLDTFLVEVFECEFLSSFYRISQRRVPKFYQLESGFLVVHQREGQSP